MRRQSVILSAPITKVWLKMLMDEVGENVRHLRLVIVARPQLH